MRRWLDTEIGEHHRERIEAPQPWTAPHQVIVRWRPEVAAARGVTGATYEGVILVMRSEKPEALRFYGISGLLAVLLCSEIESIAEG